MKKLLFIIVLISATLMACAQTEYADLPEKSSTSGADGLTIFSGGSPYKMTYSTLFTTPNARLTALEAINVSDSSKLSTDTIIGEIVINANNEVKLQQSGSNKFIAGTENWSFVDMMFNTGTALKTSTTATNTLSLSAYDVDGTAYFPFITFTAANTPTMTFPQSGGGTTNYLRADGSWATPPGGFSFENGLTEAASVVKLGGALTGNTFITDDGTHDFAIGTVSNKLDDFDMYADNTIDLHFDSQATIDGTAGSTYLELSINGTGKRFIMSNTSMLIVDGDDSQGLLYNADYSANYTARSLPDSNAVAAMITDSELLAFRTSIASDTIDLTDEIVLMNVGTANNLTVVANAQKAFPIGTQITIISIGAGQTTIVAGAGVTINSADGDLKLMVQYSSATLIKRDTDIWVLVGDIAA